MSDSWCDYLSNKHVQPVNSDVVILKNGFVKSITHKEDINCMDLAILTYNWCFWIVHSRLFILLTSSYWKESILYPIIVIDNAHLNVGHLKYGDLVRFWMFLLELLQENIL